MWEYEQVNKDPDEEWQPRDFREQEIYKYIYNTDTIDKMLQDLMTNGLKVQSGEMIGKTIIFAMNSKTAKLIVERFNLLYPEYGNGFCEQIDYSVNTRKTLSSSSACATTVRRLLCRWICSTPAWTCPMC